MLVGGLLRFWHVGSPHQLVFDETYYVKQGWSMTQFWFEMKVDPLLLETKQVDQHFTANDPFVCGTEGDFVVHPPVGKWLIGWGEVPFGILNSFGWRFAVALAGTISIFMLGRIARRLFRSDLLGTVAAALLAFEGHHFVHSRTGLLDIFVMFFGLAAFGALLIDRDTRPRGARDARVAGRSRAAIGWLGPWLGWRPWRWTAGVMLGLSTGVKWSGLYFVVFFGLLTVLWDMGARRAAGVPGLAGRVARQGRPVCRAPGRRVDLRRLRGELDGLDPQQGRVLPDVGADAAERRLRLAAGLVAIAVGLPPADVRLDPGDQLTAPLPDEPVVLADPGTAHLLLLRGAEEGRGRLRRRPVQQGDHLDRHGLDLVGRDARDLRAALHVGAAPRLAGRRDPLRHRRRLRAVVLPRRPHDLLLLRGRLRAVDRARLRLRPRPRARRSGRLARPSTGRDRAHRRLRAAQHGAVRLLLPDLRRRGHSAQ